MNFDTYLISKKIDATAFQKAETVLWKEWNDEFDQMHPASFTAQKLYLINPIRRKYPLKTPSEKIVETNPNTPASTTPQIGDQKTVQSSVNPKPSVPKPVFRPKPKMS